MAGVPIAVALAGAAVLGLAVGSFLNVVVYRLPRGESLSSPPSHCPRCGTQIRNRHNVPVLGWLMLRGRCFDCAEPISWRYPIVEAVTGLLFVSVTFALSETHRFALAPACLWLTATLLPAVLIVADRQRVPIRLGVVAVIAIAVLLAVAIVTTGDADAAIRAAIGAAGLAAVTVVAFRSAGEFVAITAATGAAAGAVSWIVLAVASLATLGVALANGLIEPLSDNRRGTMDT